MAEQNKNKEQGTQDINQLLKVRREKLANLVEAGNDPFVITKFNQEHHSDEVKNMYTEHEEKLLAGRTVPDVEGLDDAEKREIINNDYNDKNSFCEMIRTNQTKSRKRNINKKII